MLTFHGLLDFRMPVYAAQMAPSQRRSKSQHKAQGKPRSPTTEATKSGPSSATANGTSATSAIVVNDDAASAAAVR